MKQLGWGLRGLEAEDRMSGVRIISVVSHYQIDN